MKFQRKTRVRCSWNYQAAQDEYLTVHYANGTPWWKLVLIFATIEGSGPWIFTKSTCVHVPHQAERQGDPSKKAVRQLSFMYNSLLLFSFRLQCALSPHQISSKQFAPLSLQISHILAYLAKISYPSWWHPLITVSAISPLKMSWRNLTRALLEGKPSNP